MITSIGRALRLVLGRPSPSTPDGGPTEAGTLYPEVEFAAYAEDCRLSGRIQLDAERLTDTLNAHDEIVLVDALVESLVDGSSYVAEEFSVKRDELMVVEALGARGNPARRTRARPHPLAAKLGPYEVRGYVHVTPGADVLNAVRRRKPMIPLTEASMWYTAGGAVQRHRSGTLLFNRECADWLAVTENEAIVFPEIPLPTIGGPMVKDFTGALLTFQDSRGI